jgi:hypothetical protein
VNVQLEVRWYEFQRACLVLADTHLRLTAMIADLVGLGHIVLDSDLRQAIVIGLARLSGSRQWRRPAFGSGLSFGEYRRNLGLEEVEEMSLTRSVYPAFASGAKEVAAEKPDLPTQLVDGLFVLVDRLIVKSGCLIECSSKVSQLLIEILNLLSNPVQQAVTFLRNSRP